MTTINSIQLRRYTTEDLDAVIEVFQRAIREVASRDYNPSQIAAWSAVDRAAWEPHRLTRPTWVAVDGARPAGFSDLEADGHLDMMFVHPDYQGIGVASLLLRTVEAAAIDLGLKRIFTEASHTARPFFERRGFVVDGEQVVGKRGERMTNFRMHKSL
ncbi:MAG: GNAT family N-acetyltransferase [Rhizobium sp.]|nr:GNAT family N-acetyltransferase [Rhizobium sp.]